MIPNFHEDWFGRASCVTLAALASNAPAGMIVEIGSWEGRSTCALANAVEPRTVHAVDTWAGSPGEISADLAARRDVYAQWQANIDYHTRGNVKAHRMGWREYLPTIGEPIGFAFIDAEHTYLEVRDNILALLPLMPPGAVLCGDDVHHPPIREAIDEVVPGWRTEATLWIHQVPA